MQKSNYWTKRNALVDAVHAAEFSGPSGDWAGFTAWLKTDAADPYRAALEALKAFDRAHHGAPIL